MKNCIDMLDIYWNRVEYLHLITIGEIEPDDMTIDEATTELKLLLN